MNLDFFGGVLEPENFLNKPNESRDAITEAFVCYKWSNLGLLCHFSVSHFDRTDPTAQRSELTKIGAQRLTKKRLQQGQTARSWKGCYGGMKSASSSSAFLYMRRPCAAGGKSIFNLCQQTLMPAKSEIPACIPATRKSRLFPFFFLYSEKNNPHRQNYNKKLNTEIKRASTSNCTCTFL